MSRAAVTLRMSCRNNASDSIAIVRASEIELLRAFHRHHQLIMLGVAGAWFLMGAFAAAFLYEMGWMP